MFGKTRDLNDNGTIDTMTTEGFFGDETAADEAAQIAALRERVIQAESQINSQFTSLATYAQISQEQIELARAEAKASTERSEHRLTELIERERADRISAANVDAPNGSGRDVTARLDALEHSVAQIKATLDECFAQQLALAEAINRLFDHGQASQIEQAVAGDDELGRDHRTRAGVRNGHAVRAAERSDTHGRGDFGLRPDSRPVAAPRRHSRLTRADSHRQHGRRARKLVTVNRMLVDALERTTPSVRIGVALAD